jgi:dihydrofolate synthase/folylpolyglutamate synthase
MGFLHFARSRAEAVVLEVGLGGRLDSTNVCQSEVCLITNISFDHVKQLGNTLAAIAGEKAGIIKPGVPVVSGVIVPEPRDVIAARVAEVDAPLFQRGVAYDFRYLSHAAVETGNRGQETGNRSQWPVANVHPSSFILHPSSFHHSPLTTHLESLDYYEPASAPRPALPDLRLNLLGQHQAANAAGVICAVNRLRERGWAISDEAIYRGLASARCEARMEQVGSSPTVILDVAHNVASIEALVAVLRERFSQRRKIAIVASSKDKDYAGMLRLVLGAFDVVILTQYVNNPRAMEAEGLLKIAQELRHHAADGSKQPVLHATVRPADAWRLAPSIAQPDDLICITGSFFLAAELRPLVKSQAARQSSAGAAAENPSGHDC